MTDLVTIEPHPLLDVRCFVTEFPRTLGEMGTHESVMKWLSVEAVAPIARPDDIKQIGRNLLRHRGYKPTGRGKPASEYLIRAVTENKLSSINLAVDICNVVSLHSGLPISVVDFDLVTKPLKLAIAPEGTEYVFNAGGQTIKLDGLLCLFDRTGACANGVKDSQRTKTSPTTTKTLTIIWGTNEIAGHSEATQQWYQELIGQAGAKIIR